MPSFPPIPSVESMTNAANSAFNAAAAAARTQAGGIQLPFDPRALGSSLVQAGTNVASTGQQLATFASDLRVVADVLGSPLITSSITIVEQKLNSFSVAASNIAISFRSAGGVLQASANFLGLAVIPITQAAAQQFDNMATGLQAMANTVRTIKEQVIVLRSKVSNAANSVEQAGTTMNQAGTAMANQGHRLGG